MASLSLRESCMRENRTCSLGGGRRPARKRASSDPTICVISRHTSCPDVPGNLKSRTSAEGGVLRKISRWGFFRRRSAIFCEGDQQFCDSDQESERSDAGFGIVSEVIEMVKEKKSSLLSRG